MLTTSRAPTAHIEVASAKRRTHIALDLEGPSENSKANSVKLSGDFLIFLKILLASFFASFSDLVTFGLAF